MGGEGGMGGGEGGANLHFLFYTNGEFPYVGLGGGGLPLFLETFFFICIVLLTRDFVLRRKLR